MSIDSIDDLHEAEDRIGHLESLLEAVLALAADHAVEDCDFQAAEGLLAEPYCRLSCQDEYRYAEENPDDNWEHPEHCGCPCHIDEELDDT